MYTWAVTVKNGMTCYLDENPEQYFEYEDSFVDMIVSLLKALNISELCVCDLCRDGVTDNDINIAHTIYTQQLEKVHSEYRQFFIERYQTCIQKYADKYSDSMKELFFGMENDQKLNVEQVIDALRLKLRANICYFSLQCDSKLHIDFGDDCMFIKSDRDCTQTLEKISQELLEVLPL